MPRRLNPKSVREVPPTYQGIYSHAVLLNAPKKLLLVSGQIGVDPEGITAPTFEGQVLQAMDNVEAILASADLSLEHILRVTYYLTSAGHLAELTRIRQERWNQKHNAPAVTTLVISELAAPDLQVEIEVTAGY